MVEEAALPAAAVDAARAATKAFLRHAHDHEDAAIGAQAAAALGLCEAFTGRLLISRPCTETVTADGGWVRLGRTPVAAITAVACIAADGSAAPMLPGDYQVDIDASGDGWVRAAPGRLRVSYTAGLASGWEAVPTPLAQGIVRLAAHLFSERSAEPPAAVTALWRPWRRLRLS